MKESLHYSGSTAGAYDDTSQRQEYHYISGTLPDTSSQIVKRVVKHNVDQVLHTRKYKAPIISWSL